MELVKPLPASAPRTFAAHRRSAQKSTGPRPPAVAPVGVHPGRDRRSFGFSTISALPSPFPVQAPDRIGTGPSRGGHRAPLQHGWYSTPKAWTASAMQAQARGLECRARRRAESAQGARGRRKVFFGTKPTDPFRINTNFQKSLENKAIEIFETIQASPVYLSKFSPARIPAVPSAGCGVRLGATPHRPPRRGPR